MSKGTNDIQMPDNWHSLSHSASQNYDEFIFITWKQCINNEFENDFKWISIHMSIFKFENFVKTTVSLANWSQDDK